MHSGEIVKEALRAKRTTQVDLSRRIGRDQSLVSRYVNGQFEVASSTARSIAGELDIDTEELLKQLERDRFHRALEKLNMQFKDVVDPKEGTMNKVTKKIEELEAATEELRDTLKCMINAMGAVQRAAIAFSNVSAETVRSIKEYNDMRFQELKALSEAALRLQDSECGAQGEDK